MTEFIIKEKDFEPIKIIANNKSYFLNEKTIIEDSDCDKLYITVQSDSDISVIKQTIKNPILRLFAYIPFGIAWVIISVINFFCDIDKTKGIRNHTFFDALSPFKIKKSFIIDNPNNKCIQIHVKKTHYNKVNKIYSAPDIYFEDKSIQCKKNETEFSASLLKQQLFERTICGFVIIFGLIIALIAFDIMLFAKVINEIALNNLAFNILAISGMCLATLVFISFLCFALLAVFRIRRTYKIIVKNQKM